MKHLTLKLIFVLTIVSMRSPLRSGCAGACSTHSGVREFEPDRRTASGNINPLVARQ